MADTGGARKASQMTKMSSLPPTIRRMGEGTVFSLSVHTSMGGGVPHLAGGKGVPHFRSRWGYHIPG